MTLLTRAGATVAVGESLTGGLLAARLTDVPGSSEAFRGGVVAYSYDAKERLLGVPRDGLAQFGAVSAESAADMAVGARESLGATYGLSLTGVAGPDEQEGKPVGTVFAGLSAPRRGHDQGVAIAGRPAPGPHLRGGRRPGSPAPLSCTRMTVAG